MNNKASSILQNAMALLLTASAALCLCLLTGCSHEELPETGKYNTMIVLRGDGTKALAPDEAQSIVIYAFSYGTDDLVGYLYEDSINGRDIFPMNLTAGGKIDFYVILNPVCKGFEIINGDNQVEFDSHEGLTPDIIKSWKLRRTADSPGKAVPMSNLKDQVDGDHNPTGKSNRTFEVVANRNSWQEIPIQVTRAVSKVEVWFWANDNLPESNTGFNQNHQYTAINNMILTDPVNITEVFLPQGENADDYIDAENPKTTTNDTPYDGLNGGRFKPYTSGAFYSEEYFRLIWEEYILPNTFDGTTTLDVSYAHYSWDGWGFGGWKQDYKKNKTIELPYGPRNTKIIVWCQLNDNIDRSFTYEVVDWDEETIDIPAFD